MDNKADNQVLSQWLSSEIEQLGINTVFAVSGGMIVFLLDDIDRSQRVQVVSMKNEQAAGFAAEGLSRISGKPGIAFATSGPGATNLITAIGSAYFDSSPVIFVTGQVNTKEKKLSPEQRQNGFQELDIVSSVRHLTKFAAYVPSAEAFPELWREAVAQATTGRPGPVLLDIPIDVQQKPVGLRELAVETKDAMSHEIDSRFRKRINRGNRRELRQLAYVSSMIAAAERPLVLAGGGIRLSNTSDLFRSFIQRTNLPVVNSLMAVDALPSTFSQRIGFIGSYGLRDANQTLMESDLLLVLGSRLDIRQTGPDIGQFKKNKTIVRLDVDRHELSGRIRSDVEIDLPIREFFQSLSDLQLDAKAEAWSSQVQQRSQAHRDHLEQPELEFNPNRAIQLISQRLKSCAGYVVDVGQHQMWAAQSAIISESQRFMTSGGMGAMGFSLPAAVGVALSTDANSDFAVILGDGCLQMCLPELETIAAMNLNLKIFLFNNRQHGMVAQFQERNTSGRYVATRKGYSVPDFKRVVEAFDIGYSRADSYESLEDSIVRNCFRPGPHFFELEISNHALALPRLGEE